MIEFTHETTRFTVQPGNAQAYRTALDKPAKHKPEALTSVNLKRQYPAFLGGSTTTADYIQRFNSQFNGIQKPIEHTHADRVAPMLDPSIPEVVEEVDPDYVEPIRVAKPKAKTAAQYRKSIEEALFLLSLGDSDTAQCVLVEVLK
jgi:hypothetical protein